MLFKNLFYYFFVLFIVYFITICVESRFVPNNIHSDVVITSWPTDISKIEKEAEQPGFMRKQLLRFGQVASRVGNSMGSHATKISAAVDKVCEIVKTVIPLLAAVCHVGQFKFCSATNGAPEQLSEAIAPNSLDLNIQD